jgi:hypothetical protein
MCCSCYSPSTAVTDFERSARELDDAAVEAVLAFKARMFKKKVRHGPKDDFISCENHTKKDAKDVIRRCQHAFKKIFEENKTAE